VSFKGNAGDLYAYFSPLYTDAGNAPFQTANDNNRVEEDVQSLYVQFGMDGKFGSVPYNLTVGVRNEQTDVTSTSVVVPPTAIVWASDNDFFVQTGTDSTSQSRDGSYSNTLPSLDFSVDVTDDVKLRASLSKTIARPDFGNLFFVDTAGAPNRPTRLGGEPTGTSGNPNLQPLESKNADLSAEWYYDDASYVSLGYYKKEISNFVGSGVEERNMFDLRDPSSADAGTRSGDAEAILDANGINVTDVNLFTLTAMLDNPNDPASANGTPIAPRWDADPEAEFVAAFTGGSYQTFVDSVLGGDHGYDIVANSSDPLFTFNVQIPVNNRTANIDGFEAAWQHFFGDSGVGFLLNYTTVDGDVGFDVGSDPTVDQFALLGLSDSANASLIYENNGWSARLSWNWRDKYLNSINQGGDRNPIFVDEHQQFDLNVSYDVTDDLSLSFEAINLTEEPIKQFGRSEVDINYMQELDARYLLGARYTFD
jgi:TonB-dependent receptor